MLFIINVIILHMDIAYWVIHEITNQHILTSERLSHFIWNVLLCGFYSTMLWHFLWQFIDLLVWVMNSVMLTIPRWRISLSGVIKCGIYAHIYGYHQWKKKELYQLPPRCTELKKCGLILASGTNAIDKSHTVCKISHAKTKNSGNTSNKSTLKSRCHPLCWGNI